MGTPTLLCFCFILSFVLAMLLSRGKHGLFAALLLLFCFISSCINLFALAGILF